MNKVYKTKNDVQSLDLDKKLKVYCQEKIQSTFNSMKSLSKGSLAFLAPLAATGLIPSDANAQACGAGTAVFDPSGGSYTQGQLDVDGDGNADFDFAISSGNLYITAVGSMSFGTMVTSFGSFTNVISLSYGANIDGQGDYTGGYAGFGTPLNTPGTFYIPIMQQGTGFLGFIEVIFDGMGGFTIDTNQTGIATAAGDISAGVCASVPLPVELLNFDASTQEKGIGLEWATASELNNQGFEVQRSSDGESFYKVGWIEGKGTIEVRNNYNFVDESVRPNVLYYYRLKQMDYDGKHEFSPIVNAKIQGRDIINIGKIVPNPVSKEEFRIEIGSQISEDLNYELYDAFGKQIISQKESIVEGLNTIMVSTVDLTNGTYFLKINASETSEYRKIIIQK